MLIRCAEVEGRICDVRVADGRIKTIAGRVAPHAGEGTIDAQGGALFPGLHDHHIHLLALAAALESVACGPPSILDRAALATALGSATGAFLRGVGYTNRSPVHSIEPNWMPWSPSDPRASSTAAERFGC